MRGRYYTVINSPSESLSAEYGDQMNFVDSRISSLLSDNKYMALATMDSKCMPWSCVVFYAYDNSYNVYFISAVDAKHSINILSNGNVSAIIYDSSQGIGETKELKLEGKASIVKDDDLDAVIKLYAERIKSKSTGKDITADYKKSDYSGPSEFKFFKIKVEKFYINNNGRSVTVPIG